MILLCYNKAVRGRVLGMRYLKKFWREYRSLIAGMAVVCLLYLVFFAAGIGCPLKYLTGISCPGCGMTRACYSAVTFHFAEAFQYHPLWIALLPTLLLLGFLHWRKRTRLCNAVLIASALLMLGVYCWRLFFGETDVVVFAPQNSALYRAVSRVIGLFGF